MPEPVNDRLFDASVRHQVFLIRYGGATAKQIIKLINEAERDVAKRLRERLAKLGPIDRQAVGSGQVTSIRLQRLLDELNVQNRDLRVALGKRLRADLRDLTEIETDIAARRLNEAIGVDIGVLRPAPETLRAIVDGQIVRGQTLRQWFTRLEGSRFERLESAVRLGLIEGDTIPQMRRRLLDSENVTRAQAEALVRTGVNAVANQSREMLYAENEDVIKAVRWTSTLDGRTSDICRARDGMTWPLGEPHPSPPAHPHCRSTLSPITKSWDELAGRTLKPGRGARKIDTLFDRRLKEKGFTPAQRRRIIRDSRASMNGQVSGDLTYQDWLKRQPAKFQDSVLGRTRGKLFRQGGLPLDRFVDVQTGRKFTLDDLRRMNEEAWMKAGLEEGEAA